MVDQPRGTRRGSRGSAPLAGLLVAVALGWGPQVLGDQPAAAPRAEQVTLSAEHRPATLADAVAHIDAMSESDASRGEYGVAVLDRATGRLTLGSEGTVPFYSASVVKLFTVVDILHRVGAGDATLSTAQRTQIQRALRLSDNQAMTALWNAFGGPRTVTEIVALAGLHDTRPPAQPASWGETMISARDVAAVYRYALASLRPEHRQLLLSSLATPGTASSGGFDQSYGLLSRPGLVGAAGKQGWMIDDGSLYLHTSGVVGANQRYVVVVLSKQLGSVGYPAARQRLDSAVHGVAEALGLAGEPADPSGASDSSADTR